MEVAPHRTVLTAYRMLSTEATLNNYERWAISPYQLPVSAHELLGKVL